MVQKGKLAACAFALERQLKRVDLPTLGSPTMPAFMLCCVLFVYLCAKVYNLLGIYKFFGVQKLLKVLFVAVRIAMHSISMSQVGRHTGARVKTVGTLGYFCRNIWLTVL